MEEILKGLHKYKNSSGHTCVRLHYTADPEKATDAWIESEASRYIDGGRNSIRWRGEMEIDFEAGSGELVFQTFTAKESQIVVPPFTVDETYVLYGGMDWGTRNPVSFHVYAESPDKTFFAIWEYYAERQALFEVAKALKTCPYYDRLQWIACDPTMWNATVATKTGFTSIAEMFTDPDMVGNNVIDKLMAAHGRSDETAINIFRNHWAKAKPDFLITTDCPKLRSEIKNLKHPDANGRTNSTEKIVDKNNHAWDDMKYFRLSHPFAGRVETPPEFGTIGYLNQITLLAEDLAKQHGTDVQQEFNALWGMKL